MNKENISHSGQGTADQIAEYERRLKRISDQKSQLQLYADLINKLSMAKGLDKVSNRLVSLLMETLGGTNITLFYTINGTWHSIDAFGTVSLLNSLIDAAVCQAAIQKKILFIDDKTDTRVLENSQAGGFQYGATWIIPLIVENEVIGVIKMEGMLVVQPKMMDHLNPFINYSALYLKNMIENSSELKAAYDNLKRVNTKLVKEVETRKKAEANLKKNELLLKTAGRTTRFGGWSADPDGGNLVWSREVADIHEMGPDYSPTLDEAIQFYAPEWREKIAGVFKSCAIEGTPFDEEMEILTGSGRRFWVRATGEAMRDSSGTIIQVHGSFQDITGRKRAEEERNRLQAQLAQAQKMESIGRLAGGVAHDFNNMLSIILGNVEMILDDQYLEKPALPNLLQIKKAAERSANLTRQLLAFARKQTIAPQVIDLNEAVEGMLKMLRRLIGENIDLAWLPGIALWPVNIDPSQIDQILANLCVNARDAIQDIGKITIETRNISFDTDYCREHEDFLPGDYVMTAISDNGCGMDKKVLGNLFEPFFTTKGVGKGTGLGLATVYGIVKQNNGFINVYSEPENGTTFKIYLPRHAETKIVKQNSKIKQADPTGCETILLVEDEEAILNVTTVMLQRLGYTVLATPNPAKAVDIGKSHAKNIDLLITDVIMPGMNGKDLVKRIGQLFPDIKALFMSGYTSDVIAHHGVLDKGVYFIQKPFSRQELSKKVREVLDDSKSKS